MAGFLPTPRSLADMSPRERKLVALLILIALVAFVWLALVAPLIGGFAERAERRDALRRQYALGEAQLAALPRLARVAERSKARMTGYLLAAPDADRAGLALEDRLREQLDAVGGSYRGSEHAEVETPADGTAPPPAGPGGSPAGGPAEGGVPPPNAWQAHPKVMARIDGRMTRAQLVRYLDLLQSTPPWLVIGSVAVGGDASGQINAEPELDVRIEASMAYVVR